MKLSRTWFKLFMEDEGSVRLTHGSFTLETGWKLLDFG